MKMANGYQGKAFNYYMGEYHCILCTMKDDGDMGIYVFWAHHEKINGKLTQNHGSVILQLESKGSKLVPCQT